MADRNHPANTNSNTNAGGGYIPNLPRPSAAAANNPRGSATLAGVRRNLFQGPQQQSKARRPAPVSSQNSAETVRLDADVPSLADSSEIVVRDRHGEIEWGEPPSPDLEDQADVPMDNRQEIEQERQRLAEAVKSHQINSSAVPDQPEELLEAVRASLRGKVAALAEDNWMFEPEEQSRVPC